MELTLLVRRATFGEMAVGLLAIGAPNAEAQETGPATECAPPAPPHISVARSGSTADV
jgi:hypothetical protein